MLDAQRRPGGGGAAVFWENEIAAIDSTRAGAQHLRLDPRFRLLTDRLHQLGARPLGELLLELARDHGIESAVPAKIEAFAELDPVAIAQLDARYWPPLPLHEVAA